MIRAVSDQDLLQREEISLSMEETYNYLKGETILVTGGGGSIGSELCRQIIKYRPKCLLILESYENNAYDIQMELLKSYRYILDIQVVIGSIQDKNRLHYIFSKYKPGVVFHAAAHKHVPLMEENPQEAFKNNVLGTLNLAECADHYKSNKFVLISTDKAVHPTSVMGATKRIAEIVVQQMNKTSQTRYSTVRFGNVLGSNGSVLPLFKKQIEQGGPLTITHPDVTRYFMTVGEASSLVIQSGAMMKGGEIFVLDMGEQIKIVDLARTLLRLSGLRPDVDIKIEYTGLRPGEKLKEELFISVEAVSATKNEKIFMEKAMVDDFKSILKQIQAYRVNPLEDTEEAISFIRKLIPSYPISRNFI